jgi:FKBP-type peptidyl-prolyl cis-trans isomerase
MKTMKRMMAVVLTIALTGGVIAAQDQPGTTTATTEKSPVKKAAPKKSEPTVSEQLGELKHAIEVQQQQIKQLSDQVQSREQKIQQLEQRLDQSQAAAVQAQTKAEAAVAQTTEQQQTVTALKSDVTDLKTSATNSAVTLQETQKRMGDLESPIAIHYKGITITPGGFMAAESVYRNRAMGSDVNTPFNSVSMPGSGTNGVSEFFGSGRQSRVSMLAEGKLSDIKLTGYVEADFLSAGVTSNNNQSNSYTMRQRQVWGQAAFNNGWSLTGGQMWSLVTETRKGVDNRTEVLPMTIDAQYHVGFSWARQYGLRVAKNFNNRFWLAASMENPQTIFSATNNASNFAFGGAGVGGGLYNLNANYSFNAMPDFIVKMAFEPGFGHYEIFGIVSRFRDRVYPCEDVAATTLCGGSTTAGPNALGAYNDSKNGGGLGANARVTFFKKMDFGLHALYGNGIGRYGTSTLPDATVNPNGTLAPLRSYQALATLEWHLPKIDFYLNGGEEYVARRYQLDPVTGKSVGYGGPSFNDAGCYTETGPSAGSGYGFGSLANCSSNTQRIVEGTLGFWIKLHSGPKGRLQFGPQYSYVSRDAWTGEVGTTGTFVAPHGIDNMFFTSFRYYLP